MPNLALSVFARLHNVAKSTVHKEAKLIGLDTSNGLSYEACITLQNELRLPENQKVLDHFKSEPKTVKNDAQLTITPITVESPSNNFGLIPGTFSGDSMLAHFIDPSDDETLDLDGYLDYHKTTNLSSISDLKQYTENLKAKALHAEAIADEIEADYQETTLELKITALEARQAMERQKLANERIKRQTAKKQALGSKKV